MFRSLLALAAVLCSAGVASAQNPGITLGYPGYGGSGCPQNTASATLSPDGTALSILFDQFIVEAGGPSGRRVDYKSCNLAIPVNIPQGYSVSIFQVDYRGFNSLTYGARSQLTNDYFFQTGSGGSRTVRLAKSFVGPNNNDYLTTDRLAVNALVWTACGEQATLRINSNMRVYANSRMEQALSTVDSADVSAGLIYHIQWRRCY
ncbi:MAG: DUF4360 domain-containing protein [Bdellovibrionota bacterium]